MKISNDARNFLLAMNHMDEENIIDEWYLGDLTTIFTLRDGRRFIYVSYLDAPKLIIEKPIDQMSLTDNEWLEEFAIRLRRKIELKHVNQSDIAEIIGINPVSLSRILNCKSSPSIYTIRNLAGYFNCSVEDLTNFDYLLNPARFDNR